METDSIIAIKEIRDEIREKLRKLNKNSFSGEMFGPENEYSYKSLIAGLENILRDISALTKAHNIFIQISTFQQRNQIKKNLLGINEKLDSPQEIVNHLDNIKTISNGFAIRGRKQWFEEFNNDLGEIIQEKYDLEGQIDQLASKKDHIQNEYEEIQQKKDQVSEKVEEFDEMLTRLDNGLNELKIKRDEEIENLEQINEIKNEIEKIKDSIQESLNESKSSEKLINSFADKVQEREKILADVDQKTNGYLKELEKFKKDQDQYSKEAEDLIESARQALNYKTAEGISAAFQSQYQEIKNGKIEKWIWGAAGCLVLTILIGVWILYNSSDGWGIALGRIALLPFPIAGGVFCTSQYNKNKNLMEDYAYKMVLAKSIVGFSEQLDNSLNDEDGSGYKKYIEKVLDEIHRDPLRKRESIKRKESKISDIRIDEINELLEKLTSLKGD